MSEDIRENLPTLIIAFALGIAACVFAFVQICNNAGSLDVNTFGILTFAIPFGLMIVIPFIIILTSQRIGRKLYLTIVGACFALGIVVLVLTSTLMSDPAISTQLLANSPEGTTIVPAVNSPIIVMRDIAASIVCPTVGCIAGAWIGSRLHPVTAEKTSKKRKRR